MVNILSTNGWKDYQLLDSGNGLRLEQFGPYKIVRPDPQAIWKPSSSLDEWNNVDALFVRTSADKGTWKLKRAIPERWKMTWKHVSFWVHLTSFKHTGVFPEQSLQWEWMQSQIKLRLNLVDQMHSDKFSKIRTSENQNIRKSDIPDKTESTDSLTYRLSDKPNSSEYHPKILNLFAYTGIATLACANVGAKVTHVDASKPSISWARENQELSHMQDKPIRWILDDCVKFVEREIKRGNTYDGIILDPPAYGHGVNGQIWKFNESFPTLIELCKKLLSPNPLFVVVNAYAISSSSIMLDNVLKDFFPKGLPDARLPAWQGNIEYGELCLQEKYSKRLLSTGMYARWTW